MHFPTMQDTVVTRLRTQILRGALKPGQRIIERVVSGELGISKTPVREALTHLEAEGWVTITPHKGAIVTAMSTTELKEIYLVRIQLEGLAARLAAERINDSTIHALRELVSRMAPQGPSEIEEFMDLNTEFHKIFYEDSGHTILCEILNNLQNRSLRYRWAHLDLAESRTRMLTQRRLLLDLFARKASAVEVQKLIEDNLIQNCKTLEQRMQSS